MEIDEEVVGGNRRYAVRPEASCGEMLKVPGDDERSLAGDGGGQDVPVVGIGQGEAGDQVLGFVLPSSDAVDEKYRELVEAGYSGRREPYDAFFGARYALVDDPDGRPVGLMGPRDPKRRYTPT